MADDIITRLQNTAYESHLCCEAAAEIERLRAEVRDMDRRIVTLIGEHQALAIAYASAVTRG